MHLHTVQSNRSPVKESRSISMPDLAASISRLLEHLCLTFCADGAKAAALVTREAIKAIFMVKVSWDMLGQGSKKVESKIGSSKARATVKVK
jgi:hypothetical protein